MRAFLNKIKGYQNETWVWVAIYGQYTQLKEMGFATDMKDLNSYEADWLLTIDGAITKVKAEIDERNKKQRQ